MGGSLEKFVDGTLVGPSFLRIITEQFYRSRVGDRFWFENGGKLGFSSEQLKEIRKASISRLLCHNSHRIEMMQTRGFEKISHKYVILFKNIYSISFHYFCITFADFVLVYKIILDT